MDKITNFTDLIAYKKSHSLVLEIYTLTKKFPSDERFALIDQIRRAAISITSNLAEGFSRNSSKDKAYFYSIAKGSLTEVHSQILISYDLGYINKENLLDIENRISECTRLISGLIKSAVSR